MNDSHYFDNLKKLLDSYPEYTEQEKKYIINRITNSIRRINDPCMDNFRYSNGSEKETKEYMDCRELGCCGFYDDEIKLNSGRKFIFGFNYGH